MLFSSDSVTCYCTLEIPHTHIKLQYSECHSHCIQLSKSCMQHTVYMQANTHKYAHITLTHYYYYYQFCQVTGSQKDNLQKCSPHIHT